MNEVTSKYLRILTSIAIIWCWLLAASSCEDNDDDMNEEDVSLTLLAEDFVSPVMLTEAPDNTGRLFVVDQPGVIYIIQDGNKLEEPFLDIQNEVIQRTSLQDERGLLGLAFHPDFASNGRFFVYYSAPLREEAPDDWNSTSHIAEFHVSSGNVNQADVNSEKTILLVDEPQANHNAGMLAFGGDGYLYISLGDGGGADDKDLGHVDDWYADNDGGNGQDITENLLGSILRIDIDSEDPYTVPTDNPFVDKEGLDEIYAFGFRNPYRFCFDPDNKIIVADAGQDLYEEIDLVEKGGNYGWNVKEGRHCFNAADPENPLASCPDTDDNGNPLIDPVIEFKNAEHFSDGLGNVSIGGFVCQSDEISFLNGKYVFGVLTQQPEQADGAIFQANRSGNDWSYSKLSIRNMQDGEIGMYVLGFGQDQEGRVYVLTNNETQGQVYRIDP